MPSKIRVLTESTINKIAAGEVIENPASAIKELVENALDAGGTDITVEIVGGGRQLIRVTDNGCGMIQDDALLCLERHATSKIKEVEDIEEIATMGFRGEAIPSIASISKFTLLTRAKDHPEATLVIVEGGKILKCCGAERSPGTTIEVKSLFYNVPVRRKFQKSPQHDTNEILKMMHLLSLGNPTIKFQFISNHETVFLTPALSDDDFLNSLKERIALSLGKEYVQALVKVDQSSGECRVRGYIGQPWNHRKNRNGQYLFINQRPVTSPLISALVREGYGTMLGAQVFPVFVLHLDLPGSWIDVNVHPQKREVRIRQEPILRNHILNSIPKSLRSNSEPSPYTINEERFIEPESAVKKIEISLNTTLPWEDLPMVTSPDLNIPVEPIAPHAPEPIQLKVRPTQQSTVQPDALPFVSLKQQPTLPQVVATVCNYIITEDKENDPSTLCIWDQQGVHQRILYENLLKQKADIEVQTLLLPLIVEFSPIESAVIREHLADLHLLGIHIEEFGPATFAIDAIPSFFKEDQILQLLTEIAHDLSTYQESKALNKEKAKQLAITASRSAISSKKQLSKEDAQRLIAQLMSCETPFQSPLGKPNKVSLNPQGLASLFKL